MLVHADPHGLPGLARGTGAARAAMRWCLRCVAMGVAIVLLVGCKEPLYSQLSEQEANEIYTTLARVGIEAQKRQVGEKFWGIDVHGGDLPAAVDALNKAGLPRARFSSLGDLFKRDGIVPTPTEERVRFLYGVSQELSNTLSNIDGVVSARVHIVLPETDPLSEKMRPSSASVFIKHRADTDLQPALPSIKSLVMRSVEGLNHDAVYVSLFAAEPVPVGRTTDVAVPFLGMRVNREMASWLNPIGILMLIVLGSALAWSVYRNLANGKREFAMPRIPNRASNANATRRAATSLKAPITQDTD